MSHIEALKQTILQQNEDLRVYKQNEKFLREKLENKPITYVTERQATAFPLYEPVTKPEPIHYDLLKFPIENQLDNKAVKIIPSPVKVVEPTIVEKLNFSDLNDRAGVKSQKDCTIDCVFSPQGCEKCRDARNLRNQNILY